MEWTAVMERLMAKRGTGVDGHKPYEWERKRNDDLWVMETLGNRMLHKAGPRMGAKAPDRGMALTAVWRQKCKAEGLDPGCHCLCKRFDPVIMLPKSLFGEREINKEVHKAAMQLLEDAAGTIPGGLEKADLQMDVQEAICHLIEMHCHAICFRVSRRTRHLWVEGARSRAKERDLQGVEADAATRRLDRFEFEANMYLLPEFLGWCEQLRAVKGHAVEQLRKTFQKRHEDEMEAEMRRTLIEDRLRNFSVRELPTVDNSGHVAMDASDRVLALANQAATSRADSKSRNISKRLAMSRDMAMSASQASFFSSSRVAVGGSGGAEAPGKPLMCCRCGHAAVWHDGSIEEQSKEFPMGYVAPWLTRGRHGRSIPVTHHRTSTPPGRSAVVSGGVLEKTGRSLLSPQAP